MLKGIKSTKWKFIDPSGNVYVLYCASTLKEHGKAEILQATTERISTMERFLRLQHNYHNCVKFSTRYLCCSMASCLRTRFGERKTASMNRELCE